MLCLQCLTINYTLINFFIVMHINIIYQNVSKHKPMLPYNYILLWYSKFYFLERVFFVTIPIYIVEMTPKHKCGLMMSMLVPGFAIGIFTFKCWIHEV